jgi:hypothetical protein
MLKDMDGRSRAFVGEFAGDEKENMLIMRKK